MKTGVLGGTFDPIHNGHLGIAGVACRQLGLERVLFVPAREPWLKGDRGIAPSLHRVEMIKLAILSDSRYNISYVDLEREGPSYTVDTLSDLRRELGSDAELYFILGMDALEGLAGWREPNRIVDMCHLVVARRPGVAMIDLKALEAGLPGISEKIVVIDNELYDVNSTEIRQRVAAGRSIEGLAPDAVARYIRENGLYLEEG
ncbi:MAG: nicotinate-nucleotide adenylyltransferase [Dehalococcoidia bacterium]